MLKNIISEIIQSNTVFALSNGENYASVESQYEEDEQGLPVEVMCIWSNKDTAKGNIKEEWSQYQLETISIREFLEDWCIGLFNDGLAFCINLQEEEEPIEEQPLDFAFELADALKNKAIKINFQSYGNTDEYLQAIAPFIIRP